MKDCIEWENEFYGGMDIEKYPGAFVFFAAIQADALRAAARQAKNACLFPPDGGSPTEDEIRLCDAVSQLILSMIPPAFLAIESK